MPDIISAVSGIVRTPLFSSIAWAVALAAATLAVAKIAGRAVARILDHDSNPLPSSSIIINIVRAAILVFGASLILDSCFGLNTSSIMGALGVGGIAVSLGFQDTLSNLIGGLQVTFMGIVKPGDNIEVGAERGVVQDVTWRHTTIRDALGQTVVIPNSIISTTALVHLLPASRVSVPFTVQRTYPTLVELEASGAVAGTEDADAARARAGMPVDLDEVSAEIVRAAREAARAVSPVTDGPRVYFSEVGELGIRGSVVLVVEDAASCAAVADAVVRAVARVLG